jgi:hypothetical protein
VLLGDFGDCGGDPQMAGGATLQYGGGGLSCNWIEDPYGGRCECLLCEEDLCDGFDAGENPCNPFVNPGCQYETKNRWQEDAIGETTWALQVNSYKDPACQAALAMLSEALQDKLFWYDERGEQDPVGSTRLKAGGQKPHQLGDYWYEHLWIWQGAACTPGRWDGTDFKEIMRTLVHEALHAALYIHPTDEPGDWFPLVFDHPHLSRLGIAAFDDLVNTCLGFDGDNE